MEKGRRLRGPAPVEFLTGAGSQRDCPLRLAGGKRRGHLRAQAALEFMVVISAVLMLFFMFFWLYSNQIVNSIQADDNIIDMRVASAVQSAINYVYLAGDGTEYNTTIRTSGVNVTISNGVVEARSVFGAHYLPLLTARVNATTISSGDVTIRNNGGVIEID